MRSLEWQKEDREKTTAGGVSDNRKLRIGEGRSKPDKGREPEIHAAVEVGSPSGAPRYPEHARCF